MNSQHTVHLINTLWDATGGSERRTLDLYRELKRHCEVLLWSTHAPDPHLATAYPIKRIAPEQAHPADGTIVFVGVYFNFHADWLRLARPRRVIVIYNTDSPGRLEYIVNGLMHCGVGTVEIVFASEWLKQSVAVAGTVQASLIDIDAFVPAARSDAPVPAFTIGRLSRDVAEKHHSGDAQMYQRLAQTGCRVSVMGGTCLSQALRGVAEIELLPAGALPAQLFLQGLDCFFYRTSLGWREPWGRVVTEAMACGLPVVCHSSGGYSEFIEHGQNGFLFDSDEQAFQIIMRLMQDGSLRDAIGKAARLCMERMFSLAARQAVVDYYLQ